MTNELYELARMEAAERRVETLRLIEDLRKTVHDARNLRLAAQLMRKRLRNPAPFASVGLGS